MNPDRWRRIEDIFQAAAEIPAPDRDAFLDEACTGDAELRAEVESLLEHDAPGDTQIAGVVAGVAGTLDSPGETGERIGPYRVRTMLGHGGMGAVYLAERDDEQFRQLVALKLLKRGMDRGPMLERFLHERRILARLDHPNIARLLDGGATAAGLPYLAMEYVDGKPLMDYCRENSLDVNARLALFRSICAAVQYAHRNLVVHRDIKPSNILVTRDGVPKLLDFGIAKLLDSAAPAVHTVRMMTPDYASPEQVRGDPVTTAADVYSLGVLLYELLTSNKPFQLKSRTRREIERIVTTSEPPAPSSSVADPKLRREIQGDLDNIALMALRKEPQRRYSSADQFADDIRRFLEGRPVRARQDTWFYRTGKFVGRARWWLAAAAMVVISLTGATVVARRQAERAERRFQQVRRLANTFLFDFHDRIQSLPGSTSAREMVVRTALDYLGNLRAEGSASDASLQWDIANAYEKVADVQGHPFGPNLGQSADALLNYHSALSIKEQVAPASRDPVQLRSLAGTYLKLGDLQLHAGDTRSAAASFLKALARAESLSSKGPEELRLQSNVHSRLGQARAVAGDLPEAIAAYRRSVELGDALAALESNPGNRNALATSRSRLGYALVSAGKLDDALAEFRAALAIREEVLASSPAHPNYQRNLVFALVAVGDLLGSPFQINLENPEAAVSYYRRAHEMATLLAQTDARNVQAHSALHAATRRMATMIRDSDPAGALRLYREALAGSGRLLALDPRNADGARNHGFNLFETAYPLLKLGDRAGALRTLRQALASQAANAAADPARVQFRQDLIPTHVALAGLLIAARDFASAQAELDAGMKLASAQMEAAPKNLYSIRNLADCLEAMARLEKARGNPAAAARHLERSRALWTGWEREHGPNPYQKRRLARVGQT